MKSSLKKLRGLAHHHKNEGKEREEEQQRLLQVKQDELLEACQVMQDMRDCYDNLLSVAAATANSAYEFSEALEEMGTCLLEKTSLNDDEDNGKVLLMLGKVQFVLKKLLDNYRAHIIQTITTPSESLLNELHTVEEMKRQCDYKRDSYNVMLSAYKEKGRSKNAKGEFNSLQQLQSAREEFEEEATLFIFRLKSLKQGQSRSLLIQAARHHAAQLNFFRRGLAALEVVEPHVKVIAGQQHIDYQFSGLEDNGAEDGDEYSYSYDGSDDDELSFDYGQTDQGQDTLSTSRNLMELDQVGHAVAPTSTVEFAQRETIERSQAEFYTFSRGATAGSQSAPILPNTKFDSSEKTKELQCPSTKKSYTYALPTPNNAKNPDSAAQLEGKGVWPTQLWNSSPLEPDKFFNDLGDDKLSKPNILLKGQSVIKESNTICGSKMPPPLSGQLSMQQINPSTASDAKKIKRQTYSGPLMSKTSSSKPISSATNSRHSVDCPPILSLMPTRVIGPRRSVSPKMSRSTSPPPISSPKISELHELPRPPISLAKPTRPSGFIGHSAPLVPRSQEQCITSKMPSIASQKASPLPTPPRSMARSFSIPPSGQRTPVLSAAKLLEAPHNPDLEDVASPTLIPMLLTTSEAASAASDIISQADKREGFL